MHICFMRFHDIIAIWHGNVLGRVRQLEVGVSTLRVQTTWPCMGLVGVGQAISLDLSATDLDNSISPCIAYNSRVQSRFFY